MSDSLPTKLSLTCHDDVTLGATLYSAENPKGCLIIGSALGVPQGFYKSFSQHMASHGFHCITFDYRGTGDSQDIDNRLVQLTDWGTQDIEAAILQAHKIVAAGQPIHFIGHSIGGQLLGLASSAKRLSSILQVVASQPHWSRLDFPHNVKILSISHGILPLVAWGRDDFPSAKVGLASMNIPGNVARTWGRWMRNKDYLFSPKFKVPTKGYEELTQPLLSWSIDDDYMAPEKAILELMKHYPNTQAEHRHIIASELNTGVIGHMGFFKKALKDTLWHDVATVLTAHSHTE